MPRSLDLGRDVRQHELDSLEAGDRLPELLALLDVVQCVGERSLRDTERLRADPRPRAIEDGEGDLESRPLLAEAVRSGDLDLLEDDLRGRRSADAQLVFQLLDLPWARLAFEHERGDAAVIAPAVGLREDDQRPGHAAVCDELLGAADHVVTSDLACTRLHRGRIGSAARLRQRVRRDLLAGGERRTHSLLLLLAARDEDRVGAEGLHREDQRRARAGLGDLLDAHADRDARAGDAAVLLGERDAQDSVVRKQRLDVLGVFAGPVYLRRARRDAILHELADRIPNGNLLRAEFEVHPA